MSAKECERVAMARMAISDNETPPMLLGDVTTHLEACTICREEVAQLDGLSALLKDQKRRDDQVDLWPNINARIEAMSEAQPAHEWRAFVVLGLVLVVFKLFEMIPERDLGFLLKLLPLLVVVAVFASVKQNPFKINLELTLEGDR